MRIYCNCQSSYKLLIGRFAYKENYICNANLSLALDVTRLAARLVKICRFICMINYMCDYMYDKSNLELK